MTVKELAELVYGLIVIEGMQDRRVDIIAYDENGNPERESVSSVEISDDYIALNPYRTPGADR